jgi:dolichol-phosphate mannosyltransferase
MNDAIAISIVMPALDEENNLKDAVTSTLKAFDDMKINGEIIVINDGSTDETENIAKEFLSKEHRVKLINHAKPMGIGASFWDGVAEAKGEIVTMFPGDNENDPYEGLRYYQLLEHVDIVIPFTFNKKVRSLFRNTLSFIYRFIINTTFVVNLNYTNGTVLYRKSLLDELPTHNKSFFFQTDILIKIIKQGYLFAEVPYRLYKRDFGNSKAVTFPSLMNVIKGYIMLIKSIYFSESGNVLTSFTKNSLTNNRKN